MAAAAKNFRPVQVETTLTLISDKWKVLILRDLMPGTKRFGELKRVHRLGQPESADGPAPGDGAERPADPYGLSGSPAWEYTLTDLGYSLKPILDAMEEPGEAYKAQKQG